jgi:hypothetical protein
MSDKKRPFDEWRDKNENKEVKPWDVLNPNAEWASDEKAEERYKICLSCPELIKLTKQCKRCGCFMKVKSKLENATCPIGKW